MIGRFTYPFLGRSLLVDLMFSTQKNQIFFSDRCHVLLWQPYCLFYWLCSDTLRISLSIANKVSTLILINRELSLGLLSWIFNFLSSQHIIICLYNNLEWGYPVINQYCTFYYWLSLLDMHQPFWKLFLIDTAIV